MVKKKINWQDTKEVKSLLRQLALNTVCESARCPNISECFKNGQVTFMILGDICTRNCKFCAVRKGIPKSVDENEPEKIAQAVQFQKLKYVVITSVTRDDLPDYGAEHFARTIEKIRLINKNSKIEVLTPDFQGSKAAIKKVVKAVPNVFSHNLETVPRLYSLVRPGASYRISLNLLKFAKGQEVSVYTKSGLMLGLGEHEDEVVKVMHDLRRVHCDILTLGQYLQPSFNHYPVQEYLSPQKFNKYRKIGKKLGFLFVSSGPYVRSSYMAEEGYLFASSLGKV